MLSVRFLSLDVGSSTSAAGDGVRCAVQVVHGSQRYRTRLVEPTRTIMPHVVQDNKVNIATVITVWLVYYYTR